MWREALEGERSSWAFQCQLNSQLKVVQVELKNYLTEPVNPQNQEKQKNMVVKEMLQTKKQLL